MAASRPRQGTPTRTAPGRSSHLDERQRTTGVTDMLPPGMIKDAYEASKEGWASGKSVAGALVRPNGQAPGRMDISLAVGLIKDGRAPALHLSGDHGDNAMIKLTQQRQLEDARDFAACHDTAVQLQELMGKPGTERMAGGAGRDARVQAVRLAIQAIESGTPSIIHMKATAGADGHSFSLVARPDGKVDVLEAWASGHMEADLASLLQQSKRGIPKDVAIDALRKIVSQDPDVRTAGYSTFSNAYDTSARFELIRDPARNADGNEIENPEDLRAPDARIRLEVTVRDLSPKQEVMNRMEARLQALEQYKQDLQFTPLEREAYDDQMEAVRVESEALYRQAQQRREQQGQV